MGDAPTCAGVGWCRGSGAGGFVGSTHRGNLGAIARHPLEAKIVKCDLCFDRPGGPACVAACPNKALKQEER